MARHLSAPSQAEPLPLSLSEFAALLDLAPPSIGGKVLPKIYWLSVLAFCLGMLAEAIDPYIGLLRGKDFSRLKPA